MTVHELNQDELGELKETYIFEFNKEFEVSIQEVINYYDGIEFVDEDFFCNL